jgi:hypothetical protein
MRRFRRRNTMLRGVARVAPNQAVRHCGATAAWRRSRHQRHHKRQEDVDAADFPAVCRQRRTGDVGDAAHRYCRADVEKSRIAGFPTHTCMTYHSQLYIETEMLAPVRASLTDNRPIRANKVNKLLDYVHSDHSIHIAKGVGCTTCHGPVTSRWPLPIISRAVLTEVVPLRKRTGLPRFVDDDAQPSWTGWLPALRVTRGNRISRIINYARASCRTTYRGTNHG